MIISFGSLGHAAVAKTVPAKQTLAEIKAKSFPRLVPERLASTPTYKYDLLGRISEVNDTSGAKMVIKRDLFGKVSEITYADGTKLTYNYNLDGTWIETVTPPPE